MKKSNIDYKTKKYSNPFFGNRRKRHSRLSAFFLRGRVIIFSIFALTAGIIWFFFFSSVFSIKLIDIRGAGRVSAADMEAEIWKQADKRWMILGSQRNIFLFDGEELAAGLRNGYYPANLSVKKKFPATIIVNLEEKDCVVIWREGENDYCLDAAGGTIFSASLSTIPETDCPLIRNFGDISAPPAPKTDSNIISYAVKLREELKDDKYGFKLEYFIVDNELNSLKVAIAKGPKIYFNTKEDAGGQLARLVVLKEKTLKDDFMKKEYIDLRYGDKVYYK